MLELLFWGALMLGLCIFIHELGHYVFGRLVGVEAEIFSIGYGRGLWKKKIGVTTWQITAFPLGGYVKFYGDDIYEHNADVPGGFFSVGPLRRMVPVLGGPLFNLFLGALIFLAFHLLSGPIAPVVHVDDQYITAARDAGLRSGDRVLAINGQKVRSFEDISQQVHLSSGESLLFQVERPGKDGQKQALQTTIRPVVDDSGIAYVGVRPAGPMEIQVNFPLGEVIWYRFQSLFGSVEPQTGLKALKYLQDGDVLLAINGQAVESVEQIQLILGQHHGQTVQVRLRRESLPWISWRWSHVTTIDIPSTAEYRIDLHHLVDLYYNTPVSDISLRSYVPEHQRGLEQLQINSERPASFESLYTRFAEPAVVDLQIAGNEYRGQIQAVRIGLLGFSPSVRIVNQYLPAHESLLASLAYAWSDLFSSVAVYPRFFASIFAGRMSFLDNAAGPVKIIGIAGIVARSDWRMYLRIFASISVALFVMNLLPFPVLDGGHLMFFAWEAVAGRPLPAAWLDRIYRVAMSVLLMLFVFIMYKDVLWSLGL
ncbi:MAG: site-2 protease family protein [Leptospiraceae bacterium]|nr:site-2 protease family protein [Leptospiraceae bacterium]